MWFRSGLPTFGPVDVLVDLDVNWGVVVVLDLETLVGQQLPHEFEAFVGRILDTCRFVVLPSLLPDTSFFSYWPDTATLVHAAARTAGRVAVVKSSKRTGKRERVVLPVCL